MRGFLFLFLFPWPVAFLSAFLFAWPSSFTPRRLFWFLPLSSSLLFLFSFLSFFPSSFLFLFIELSGLFKHLAKNVRIIQGRIKRCTGGGRGMRIARNSGLGDLGGGDWRTMDWIIWGMGDRIWRMTRIIERNWIGLRSKGNRRMGNRRSRRMTNRWSRRMRNRVRNCGWWRWRMRCRRNFDKDVR